MTEETAAEKPAAEEPGAAAPEAAPTLGERLDSQARVLAARRLQPLAWAGPLRLAAERALARAEPLAGRYERIEQAPPEDGQGFPAPVPAVLPARVPVATPASPPAGVSGGRTAPAGRPLPGELRGRLRAVAGPAADLLRIHDGPEADALARSHRAEAVTIGRDIHFRSGRYRPQERDGFALLAHEATHVMALLRPGAAWRRATGAGQQEEEREALAVERAVLRSGGTPGTPGRSTAVPDARPRPGAPRTGTPSRPSRTHPTLRRAPPPRRPPVRHRCAPPRTATCPHRNLTHRRHRCPNSTSPRCAAT
ncbi:eCIS core domain-containing protein [Kitasatospora azatica]|uniref:eCIS core domain-containing protein n=1 Tax=Kitasatospora azatica TaxID=58347 RepID=UPI000559E537|nr:DUF4157 domain-containing protein [Kitasatospora azatica]